MGASITFLGHSAFLIDDGTHRLAIDPFLTGNPAASTTPDQLRCTHIALTHGHEDHVGDTVSLAADNNATVFAAFELANHLQSQGVERLEPGNPGGTIPAPFGSITFTQAFHSSSHQGVYTGQPCGVIARIGGLTLYHLGDTALFGDLRLIGERHRPDVAMVPVGDRFTMGPAEGAVAAELVGARVAIPIHYGTWPLLTSDISAFAPQGVEVRALEPGESIEL